MAHNPLSVSSAEYNSHHLHLVIQFSAAIRKRKKKNFIYLFIYLFIFLNAQKKFGKIKKTFNFGSFRMYKEFFVFNTLGYAVKYMYNNKAFAERKKIIIIEIFLENCNEYICIKKHFTLRKRKMTSTHNTCTMHQISYFFK